MLINIKQVAKDFKVSTRTIQMWCKAEGIKKIGNEYQLTNDIIEAWRIDRTKTKTKSTNENASPTKQKHASQRTTIIITSIILLLLCGVAYFYTENSKNIEVISKGEKQNEKLNIEINQVKEKNNQLEINHVIDSMKYKALRDSIPKRIFKIKKPRFIINGDN